MYPGGIKVAKENFDDAYDFAIKYPYCSLSTYAGVKKSPIIDTDILGEIFSSPEEYKEFARDCILGMDMDEELGILELE